MNRPQRHRAPNRPIRPTRAAVSRSYVRLFTESAAPMAILDAAGNIADANPAFCAAAGLTVDALARAPLSTLVAPSDRELARRLESGGVPPAGPFPMSVRRPDGRYDAYVWTSSCDEKSRCTFLVGHADVDGSALSVAQDRLLYLSRHDALTGLPNRDVAVDHLQQAIYVAYRHDRTAALLAIDLDRFKAVNDSLGHAVGDRLLESVARRIVGPLRAGDTVARLGADTFLLVLADVADAGDVAAIADRALAAVRGAYEIEGHDLVVDASIGVAVFPGDGDDAPTLLRNAEVAMFQAKAAGGGAVQFCKRELQDAAYERMNFEQEMRKAIDRREFVLHYQPIVAVGSGAIVGAEALVRWRHPRLGLVPPDRFIPLAEDSGLIVPIGEWVIETACRESRSWHEETGRPLELSINISPRQFRERTLGDLVDRVIRETGVASERIEFEITETTIMRDAEAAAGGLGRLKALGIKLSVDDFGTGYSSLGYLRRLPLDTIKIDRTFIRDVTESAHDQAIARTIVGLGHNLGLRVIAEGVEDRAQLETLRGFGCDLAQGYLFSKALPASEFSRLVRDAAGTH
jgi:diguanylate cyclase (GGDEF)-like protein/PAS domain S-box-containing protein